MIRTLIIEDEPSIQELIADMVQETDPEIIIDGICDNMETAKEAILRQRPQLVFLDIMLPGGTAFELLQQIGEIDFEIIFITAYNDFMTDAFRYGATGYLVKPVSQTDLEQALRNARKRIMKGLNAGEIVALLEASRQKQVHTKKLAIAGFNEYIFVDLAAVIRCESQNMYSIIYTAGQKKMLSSFSLKQLSQVLPETDFFQVHKCHIVSLNEVTRFNMRDTTIVMSDGAEIPVSRRRKQAFLDQFVRISRTVKDE